MILALERFVAAWDRKWLLIDDALESMADGRGCLGALDCLNRAEVAAQVTDDQGCVWELPVCVLHSTHLVAEMAQNGLCVRQLRNLEPDELLVTPGDT